MNKKSLTEAEIRSQFIRPALVDAGWQGREARIREEWFFTDGRMNIQGKTAVRGKRSFIDYLLIYKNVPLAIIEAKDNNHSVGAGMQQALRYAAANDVPFVYSSNGDGFLEHNMLARAGKTERRLALNEFPAPEVLWQEYKAAHQITPEQEAIITERYYTGRDVHKPRYYQEVAINKTVTAIAQGQRRLLLVMATGTGKTYTAFQIIWRLWRARTAKRILFLADRNILVDQAKTGDFKHFGDKLTKIQDRTVNKAFEIYLALYQAVSGTEEEMNIYKQFSRDFFDLVIVDECHRGSAAANSAWREILEYYDSAVQIGLTATPKETEEVSNIDYFGEPIYTYSLKQGIEDGFLAPYKVIRVDLDKDLTGWMPEEGMVDRYGNELVIREYNTRDYDRTIVFNKRNELVARRIWEYMEATDPYGKTIVFCVDIPHAERMREALVNAIGEEAAVNRRFVMQMTGDNPEGKMELHNFISVEESFPVIATTSKLLTTGVDAQTCKLIVLDAIINSMTEFKQIIGRGTRLRPDAGKTHFTIMDFRKATELFYDPKFDGEPVQIYEPGSGEPIAPPEVYEDVAAEGDEELEEGVKKFYIDDVEFQLIGERVQYYDADGRLVTKSFVQFSKENVQKVYGSLDAFLQRWDGVVQKHLILTELLENGVMVDELRERVGEGYDLFDLICHVAFDRPPLTRAERVRKVQKADYFTEFGEVARQVLAGLLEKYADEGVVVLEQAADGNQAPNLLKVAPFPQYGSPQQIAREFGGPQQFFAAVRRLSRRIYAVQ